MSSANWYTEYSAEAHDLIAGTVGGCSGVLIGQPFDLVKVRLQCNLGINNSVLQTVRHIAKNEGILAFWKGTIPPLLANVPINAIGFASYGNSQRFLGKLLEKYNPSPSGQLSNFDNIDYAVPMRKPSSEQKDAFLNDLCQFNSFSSQLTQHHDHEQIQSQSKLYYLESIQKLHMKYPTVDFSVLRNVQSLHEIESISIYRSSPSTPKVDFNWHAAVFLAGCWSGLLSCLISTPSELLKIQEQNYQGQVKVTSFSLAKMMTQQHGFSSLYRGFWITVWRDCPSVGLYFWVYEYCKWSLRKETFVPTVIAPSFSSSASPQFSSSASPQIVWNQQIEYDFTTPLLGGCLAGPLSWLSTYPLDVVKSRLQTLSHDEYKKTSMVKVFREIAKKQGYKFFFTGLGTTLFQSAPVTAVTFLLYERTLQLCKSEKLLMPQIQ